MKKVLALLLALAMVFTLCACGKNEGSDKTDSGNQGTTVQDDNNVPDDTATNDGDQNDEIKEETIVGKWTGKLDMWEVTEIMLENSDEKLDDALVEAMKRLYKGIAVKLTLEFDEAGEVTMTQDLSAAMEDIVDNVKENPDILVDYLAAMLEAEGVTPEDFEAAEGVSVEDYVEQLCDSDQISSFFGEVEDMTVSLEYKLSGNKLSMITGSTEEIFTIELDGNEMTILDYANSNTDLGAEIGAAAFKGMTLKRK